MLLKQHKIICSDDERKEIEQEFGVTKTIVYEALNFTRHSERCKQIREYAKDKFKLPVSTIYKNV